MRFIQEIHVDINKPHYKSSSCSRSLKLIEEVERNEDERKKIEKRE